MADQRIAATRMTLDLANVKIFVLLTKKPLVARLATSGSVVSFTITAELAEKVDQGLVRGILLRAAGNRARPVGRKRRRVHQ